MKYLEIKKRRFKKCVPTVTIMCDYCADGIWWNGGASTADSKRFPYSIKIMKNRIRKWQDIYETFTFYNMTNLERKLLINGYKYKQWLKEGYEIAKIIRRKLPKKITVEYFNETTAERIIIK